VNGKGHTDGRGKGIQTAWKRAYRQHGKGHTDGMGKGIQTASHTMGTNCLVILLIQQLKPSLQNYSIIWLLAVQLVLICVKAVKQRARNVETLNLPITINRGSLD
jgi:hypothetical protein